MLLSRFKVRHAEAIGTPHTSQWGRCHPGG